MLHNYQIVFVSAAAIVRVNLRIPEKNVTFLSPSSLLSNGEQNTPPGYRFLFSRSRTYIISEKTTMDRITLGPMPYMSVMPTVLVGANVKGKPNYMTAAWATVACMAPPMVCVALNKTRYTVKGIEENKTFSLNVPSLKQVVETDHCGLVSGNAGGQVSRSSRSTYGKLKTAPLAEECPVNIECRLFKSVDCGSHLLYIGEVVEIRADKDLRFRTKK